MSISLTVSEVRQALQQAAGRQPTGDGAPSTALLGTMFHRVISDLLREDSGNNLESTVRDLEPDLAEWQRVLVEHTYDHLLGPLLTNQSGALRDYGTQVMDLWTAVQDAVRWLAEVWWQITDKGTRVVNQSEWFRVERPVVLDLHQPHWTEPVVLLGQTDAVLRIPGEDRWCVLEWKLGQTSPLLDHGQACLYHLMLTGNNPSRNSSALAVVSFHPQRHESLFSSPEIVAAQSALMDLIGRIAGVLPPATGVLPPANAAAAVAPVVSAKAVVSPPASVVTAGNKKVGTTLDRAAHSDRAAATSGKDSGPSEEWLREMRDRMLRVLRKFGVPCRESKPPVTGPAFVRFSLFPEGGIRQKKVLNGAPELHLHLGLPAEPVMTVVDGSIAIDLPNPNRESVAFSELLSHLPTVDDLFGCSKVPVGLDLNRHWVWCDLAGSESPHMLVIGTPGSGKSQWLRSAVASLMKTNTPATLQLLLIDPKQNAFTFASNSPFLRQPIVVPGSGQDVSEILEELTVEMDGRYTMLAETQSQSLTDHIRKTRDSVPRIICVCDEYADLLEACEKSERQAIEKQLRRISAKGRAAGIHLILATQQPRATVVTPAIRAMLPAKVALRVSDARESRIALEESGAERLLGNGDLLFKSIGTKRLQAAWLPEEEEHLLSETQAAIRNLRRDPAAE